MTNLVNLVGTVFSFFLVDRLGRRPLLLAGSVIMFVGHIVVGVAGLKSEGNMMAQKMIVAFVLIYVFGFAASWGPLYAFPLFILHDGGRGANARWLCGQGMGHNH
jgi:MFS transporter, SP family, sugar:H+ symporter